MNWFFGSDLSPDTASKAAAGAQIYQNGQQVEYFSGTLNAWIPAKILAFNADKVSELL